MLDRRYAQRLGLKEFNKFDAERTLRENSFDLERENIRIELLVKEMVEVKIPVPIIMNLLHQLTNNAAEIMYINSLVQHNIETTQFQVNAFRRKGGPSS